MQAEKIRSEEVCAALGGISARTLRRLTGTKLQAETVQDGALRYNLYNKEQVEEFARVYLSGTVRPTIETDGQDRTGQDAPLAVRQDRTGRDAPLAVRQDRTGQDAPLAVRQDRTGQDAGGQLGVAYLHGIDRAADALERLAESAEAQRKRLSPVLSVRDAKDQYQLSEKDMRDAVERGLIKIRRGARGARMVLRDQILRYVWKIYEEKTGCA